MVRLRQSTIRKSVDSYRSKIKAYLDFCSFSGAQALPVSPLVIGRFVAMFRNGRSAQSYLTAVAWLCDALGFPVDRPDGMTGCPVWRDRGLKQILRGSIKDTAPPKRATAVPWELTIRLVRFAASRREPEMALAYVLASVFMLRVQNELLPLETHGSFGHSSIEFITPHGGFQGDSTMTIVLNSRKNRPSGSRIVRNCLCRNNMRHALCPVHAFEQWCRESRQMPGRVFRGLDYTRFVRAFRLHLAALNVPDAANYTSHGFRRGTAQEMLRNGSRLAEILTAGDWRSPAFLAYLETAEIEEGAVLDILVQDREPAASRVVEIDPPAPVDTVAAPLGPVPKCRAPVPPAPKKRKVDHSVGYRKVTDFFPVVVPDGPDGDAVPAVAPDDPVVVPVDPSQADAA